MARVRPTVDFRMADVGSAESNKGLMTTFVSGRQIIVLES